jgi:integrase
VGFVSQVGLEQGAANGRPAEPSLHDLRHTGGTLSAAAGATLKELMARLRHSSVRASMIYQHATRDRDKSIAAALGKFFDATQDDSE